MVIFNFFFFLLTFSWVKQWWFFPSGELAVIEWNDPDEILGKKMREDSMSDDIDDDDHPPSHKTTSSNV